MILEKAPYLNHFNTILESLFLHYNLLKTPCGTIILQQFDSGSYLICSAMCVVQNKNFVLYKFTYPGIVTVCTHTTFKTATYITRFVIMYILENAK